MAILSANVTPKMAHAAGFSLGKFPLNGGVAAEVWFEGAILFLETSEQAPSPASVDGILMDYENMGVFSNLAGLLFGRPMAYSDDQKETLRQVIVERTASYSFPVVSDMDFGHTAPQFVLPIGCRARIDSDEERVSILEAAVT